MKKKIFTLFIISMAGLNSFSQTIKENIDKAAKDKSNAERAAKADVLIHKKIITDTTVTKITPTKVVTRPVVKRKKKYYSSKTKKKSKTS